VSEEIPEEDIRVDRIRGSGRGGQRRNKRETAIRVTHLPTGTMVTRMSGRSQVQNLEDALYELNNKIASGESATHVRKLQAVRNTQTDTERSGKSFTHVFYRDEVVHHATGKRWRIKDWKQGRM
jgi:protein subunit release factor A